MPLPSELRKIKASLEVRQKDKNTRLSKDERDLLGELEQLDKRLTYTILNEIQSSVTKMTGPGGNVCGCCGRPF
jgi:hypothetical protein